MESYIYFIAAEAFGVVKIGISVQPLKRLANLQTAAGCQLTLLGFIPGSAINERAWHDRFAAKRTVGEWFALDDEIRNAIALCVSVYPTLAPASQKSRSATRRLREHLANCVHGFLGPECTGDIGPDNVSERLKANGCGNHDLHHYAQTYGISFVHGLICEERDLPTIDGAYAAIERRRLSGPEAKGARP